MESWTSQCPVCDSSGKPNPFIHGVTSYNIEALSHQFSPNLGYVDYIYWWCYNTSYNAKGTTEAAKAGAKGNECRRPRQRNLGVKFDVFTASAISTNLDILPYCYYYCYFGSAGAINAEYAFTAATSYCTRPNVSEHVVLFS